MSRRLAIALAIALPASARAEPRRTLLLLASPASDLDRDALADAIRLQVLDLGVDVDVAEESEPALAYPERLHAAAARLDETGASLALFYDRAAGDRQAVLYAVHKDADDEAVVAVIRLSGEPSSSLYRSFALRVRDLVADATLVQRPQARRTWAVAVGYAAAWLPSLEPWLHGPEAALVRTLRPFEAALELSLSLPRSAEPPTGTAELTTLGARLVGRRIGRVGPAWLGGGPRAGAFLLFAEGRSGTVAGDIFRAVPVLGAEGLARVAVAAGIDVELAATAELLVIRERFNLAEARAFDLGHWALGFRVSLLGHK